MTRAQKHRRTRSAHKFDVLDRLEQKTVVTEPINMLALSLGGWAAWLQGLAVVTGGTAPALRGREPSPSAIGGPPQPMLLAPLSPVRIVSSATGGAGGSTIADQSPVVPARSVRGAAGDWLSLRAESESPASLPSTEAVTPRGNALRSRGAASPGSGGPGGGVQPVVPAAARGQISPVRVPPPATAPGVHRRRSTDPGRSGHRRARLISR